MTLSLSTVPLLFAAATLSLCPSKHGASTVSNCMQLVSHGLVPTNVKYLKECDHLHREKKNNVTLELSRCAWCQDVLKDPVFTTCRHWSCRSCISTYWDQSALPGDSSCPECVKRFQTKPGLQTASQTSILPSKTVRLLMPSCLKTQFFLFNLLFCTSKTAKNLVKSLILYISHFLVVMKKTTTLLLFHIFTFIWFSFSKC